MALPINSTLTNVTIKNGTTNGTFNCNTDNLYVDQLVTITGTNGGTGSITGYTSGKVYKISSTNGSTEFILIDNSTGLAITTAYGSSGTLTGLTFAVTFPLIKDIDYNQIRSEVNSTLGQGTGDRGYGQTLNSTTVSAGNLITAQHMVNLKLDVDRVSYHQTNFASSAPAVSVGGTITASDWNTYFSQINTLTTNRLTISDNAAQSTWVVDGITGSSPFIENWNGNRTHSVTIDFGTLDAARFFFNTGGEIRIVPSQTNPTSQIKSSRWALMFSTLGTLGVRIRAHSTLCAAIPSGSTLQTANHDIAITPTTGYYELTTTNTKIFEIIDRGTYSGNDFTVLARISNPLRYMYVDILFRDDTLAGGTIDEPVSGRTTSTVGHFRATGSYVSVASPGMTGATIA